MYIYPSERLTKRLKAVFHDGTTIHFGSKNGFLNPGEKYCNNTKT